MKHQIRMGGSLTLIAFLFFLSSSCARSAHLRSLDALPPLIGFYHTVEASETLSGISELYGVPPGKIAKANHLSDPNIIEAGQMLYIPIRPRSAMLDMPEGKVAATGLSNEMASVLTTPFMWPIRGEVITRFGARKNESLVKGINIAGKQGEAIRAAQSGIVTFADDEVSGMGKMIVIDHGQGLQTVYAHNAENLVKVGERIRQNDIIARVGSTGRAEVPFLHFEVRKNHRAEDPMKYINAS